MRLAIAVIMDLWDGIARVGFGVDIVSSGVTVANVGRKSDVHNRINDCRIFKTAMADRRMDPVVMGEGSRGHL